MKIVTWNVNSIAVRINHVLDWLNDNRPDVVCLQEIKCVNEKFPAAQFKEAGYFAVVSGQQAYNGVATLSLVPAEDVATDFAGDAESGQKRFIAASYNGVKVINTYFPNGQALDSEKFVYKMAWMKQLREYFDSSCAADQKVALCGDFNIAPDDRDVYDPIAWEGEIHCSPEERAALQTLKVWGLVDTFREHETANGFYSWWNYREGAFRRNAGLRIDHIWTTRSLADLCRAAWIDKTPRMLERPSDHAPVIADFDL